MAKIGNQIPTLAIVLPYTESLGGEAVALYNMTENTLQEWQKLLINDIMATTDGGLWTHTKFGYAVSRRNGKTEVVTDRELWGLFNGEHILHTAHLTDTAHIAWERLKNRIESLGVVPKSTYKAYGKERIELNNGGVIDFRTRTSSGALGSGYDLLVIDEAQEYTRAQQTALNYVTSSSKTRKRYYAARLRRRSARATSLETTATRQYRASQLTAVGLSGLSIIRQTCITKMRGIKQTRVLAPS